MKIILIILTLFIFSSGLLIPIGKGQKRCMIAFAYGESDSVKLEFKFPKIPDIQSGEYYQVLATNTETKQVHLKTITHGVLRYQLDTVKRVIYEVCVTIKTNRYVGKLNVDYSANSNFQISTEVIKVPQNLLKSEDLKGTYENSVKIVALGDKFLEVQQARLKDQQKMFNDTRDVGNSLVTLSIFELVVIFITALFQLFTLKQHLAKNHYI